MFIVLLKELCFVKFDGLENFIITSINDVVLMAALIVQTILFS